MSEELTAERREELKRLAERTLELGAYSPGAMAVGILAYAAAFSAKERENEELRKAVVGLNTAIDAYWNVGPGRQSTSGTIRAIEAAQQVSRAALSPKGGEK